MSLASVDLVSSFLSFFVFMAKLQFLLLSRLITLAMSNINTEKHYQVVQLTSVLLPNFFICPKNPYPLPRMVQE